MIGAVCWIRMPDGPEYEFPFETMEKAKRFMNDLMNELGRKG